MSLVRFIRLTSVTILLLFSDRPSDILLLYGSVLTLSQVLRSYTVKRRIRFFNAPSSRGVIWTLVLSLAPSYQVGKLFGRLHYCLAAVALAGFGIELGARELRAGVDDVVAFVFSLVVVVGIVVVAVVFSSSFVLRSSCSWRVLGVLSLYSILCS